MKERRVIKELETGAEVLDNLSGATAFNNWIFEQFLPHCKGNILEIGSGTGNISNLMLQHFPHVTLSNIESYYNKILAGKFAGNPSLEDIITLDIVSSHFDEGGIELTGKFDTVIAVNVIEHVEDDMTAFRNCGKLLNRNGHLLILVPAYQWLYNRVDKNLGHFRRYTAGSLKKKLPENFRLLSLKYFNLAGIPGWFFNGHVLNNEIISRNKVNLFNKLVPALKLLDKLVFNKAGLSVVMVAEKQ